MENKIAVKRVLKIINDDGYACPYEWLYDDKEEEIMRIAESIVIDRSKVLEELKWYYFKKHSERVSRLVSHATSPQALEDEVANVNWALQTMSLIFSPMGPQAYRNKMKAN